jgi:lysophospholipase L1-like esterase
VLKRIRLLGVLALAAGALSAQQKRGENWVGTWAAAPHASGFVLPGAQPLREIHSQTIRMIVGVSLGGSRARVRFSNAYGKKPLAIGAAHIAIRKEKAAIVPGTDRTLLFGGKGSFSIPPGALVLSDAVDLDVPDSSDVAVTVYVPGDAELSTVHGTVPYASYVSESGDFTGTADLAKSSTQRSWYWLDGIDVAAPANTEVVVAFGDSITDGAAATPDTNGSWPSVLARRLLAQPGPKMAVLNLGISGNRILNDGMGVSALARFDADVLARPGVRSLIVLEGINDIGFPNIPRNFGNGNGPNPFSAFNTDEVSADDIISGLRQIIERARTHGLKVYGGTLTPYEGAMYFSPQGEAKRQAVNDWIRSSGAFDGVIDFDAAVRDPQHPAKFLPAYQSGDNLHPSNAGYKVMADAIDLSMLRGKAAKKK